VTEDELRLLAVEAADEGQITEEDQVLIDRVFRFGDRRVDDIMVPRPDVVAVQVETPVEEALEIALRSGHRRLPVYEGTLEDVVGVVKLRDLVAGRDAQIESIRSVADTPLVVPKSKQVTSLLDDMQEQNKHLALVVDEYGVIAGIVTIEDVVEDLVGSISEGPDRIHLERVADGRWIVSGAVPVEDLTAELDIEIPEGEWNTVAGMMLGVSGQVLGPGSVLVVDEHLFRVESVRGRRITRVSVQRQADDRV
jgi:CBS domain containing-hemolysin-like protein